MTQSTLTLTPKDYKSDVKPTWCPGCGDFGVLNAIYNSHGKPQVTTRADCCCIRYWMLKPPTTLCGNFWVS